MFQFPAFAHLIGVHSLQLCGLPHSDTCGSFRVDQSPHFFVVYYVLRRYQKPRHPLFALVTSLNMNYYCSSFFLIYLYIFLKL